MSDSLRYKDFIDGSSDDGITVKINEENKEKINARKTRLNFKAMWYDAFLRGRSERRQRVVIDKKLSRPAPYMYLRISITMVLFFIVAAFAFYMFNGFELYPVLVVVMALFLPVTLVVFFHEIDTSGRLSIYNVALLFLSSCAVHLAIQFLANRFIFELFDEVTLFGSFAMGLMEAFLMFVLCSIFVFKYKKCNGLTGIQVGAIVGSGFAVASNCSVVFESSFIVTEYLPGIDTILYNATLFESFNSVLSQFLVECLGHSGTFILVGASFGGFFSIASNYDWKNKSINATFGILVFTFLCSFIVWYSPFGSVSEIFKVFSKVLSVLVSIVSCWLITRNILTKTVFED